MVEADIIAALQARKIAGAAIDVFDQEPLPLHDRIRQLPNTVLTPHLGYVVTETMRHFYAQSAENALAFIDGAPVRVMNLGVKAG